MMVTNVAPNEMVRNSANNSDDIDTGNKNNSPSKSTSHIKLKKRRSAAERRASHRRRSSQANDPQQIIQLLNGLQQRRNSQDENNDEIRNGEQEKNVIGQMEEGRNNRLTDSVLIMNNPEQFPPEPILPAPGGDDETEQEICLNKNKAAIGDFLCGLDISADITNTITFKPIYQRSISDHLLRYDQLENGGISQREISITDAKQNYSELPKEKHKHLFQSNFGINKRADVSRRPPLLAHIRKLKQQDQPLGESTYASNAEQPEERANETNYWLRSRDYSPGLDSTGINLFAKSLDLSRLETTANSLAFASTSNFSSSSLAQLVGRFSSQRQNSDSNLFRKLSPKGDELAGSRRSFKWKSFLRRRNEVSEIANGRNNKLGPVPEDTEAIEIGQIMKKHPVIMDEEIIANEEKLIKEVIRVRTNSSNEGIKNESIKNCQQQQRPFSVIGTGMDTEGELIKYRIGRHESLKFEQFIRSWTKQTQKQSKEGYWDSSEEENEIVNTEEKENYGQTTGINAINTMRRKSPPRMGRPARRNLNSTGPNISFATTHVECQTMSRPIRQKLQRAVSSRAENTIILSTLPRKKSKVLARNARGGAVALPARRKSIALQVGGVQRHQKILAESTAEITTMEAKATAATITTTTSTHHQQQQQQQIVMVAMSPTQQQRLKSKRASMSVLSLRHLLAGSDRHKAKVAPKTMTSTTSIKERKAVKAGETEFMAEQHDEEWPDNNINTYGDKKREHKGNSMILDTILSIRPRRKKDNTPQRNLENLWSSAGVDEKGDGMKDVGIARSGTINGDGDKGDLTAHAQSPPSFSTSTSDHHHHHQHSLPPVLSPLFGGSISSSGFSSNSLEEPNLTGHFVSPQLVQARWQDLDLWSEQAPNWTAKFGANELVKTLIAAERKRQNVIYELILTERHHCQVLVLLSQLYREGLLQNGILTIEQVKKLIPDVLDSLLDFHLTLFRQLHHRCIESPTPVVDNVLDILIEEFESGQFRNAAIQSYTHFCCSRDDSIRQFTLLMTENSQFRKFMEFNESRLKDRTFKDCLLLIAQRLTKYPILVEQIVKLESRSEKQDMARCVYQAVRNFAMEVDQELQHHELNKQWNALKKALDKGSTAKLVNPDPKDGKEFTVEDLIWPVENYSNKWGNWGRRRIILVAKVFWRETMDSTDVELRLLLCDDLIIFLRPKNSASNGTNKLPPLQMFRHRAHAGVLPLHSTLVKSKNNRQKSLFLILTDNPPDLFPLSFSTTVELEQCAQAIEKAKKMSPNFVRRANGESSMSEEKPIEERMADWDKRKAEAEYQVKMEKWRNEMEHIFDQRANDEQQFFDGLITHMDTLRLHLGKMPQRKHDQEQTKQLLLKTKAKFVEVEQKRMKWIAKFVEKTQKIRDEDMLGLLDDPMEGRKQSVRLDDNEHELKTSEDSSEEERRKPRRVSTYHGIVDQKQKRNSGGSSSGNSTIGGAIRRHTTVPGNRTYHQQYPSSEEEELERDELNRLPFSMGSTQREVATKLIRKNILLMRQIKRMEEERKLDDMIRSAVIKAKSGSKNPDVKEECEDDFAKKLREKAMELERKEKELARLAAELKVREEKQLVGGSKNDSPQQRHRQTTSAAGSTPTKFNTPKFDSVSRVQSQNDHSISGSTSTTALTFRISNTYCGAGPVPTPNGSNDSRSVENSPTLLNADRRAISQTELPRHLVSKTETKQKQKRK